MSVVDFPERKKTAEEKLLISINYSNVNYIQDMGDGSVTVHFASGAKILMKQSLRFMHAQMMRFLAKLGQS